MAGKETRAAAKRRARGTGSIFRDQRRGGWVARVPVGRKANGRVKYREVRGPTQQAVIARMRQAEPPAPTLTLSQWLDRWMPTLHLRDKSRLAYDVEIRHRLKPVLGAVPLARLTAFQIEEAIATWGKQVGGRTIRLSLTVLSSCLQAAVRAGVIASNPASLVRRPPLDDRGMHLFSPAELRAIIQAARDNPRYRVLGICAATGMRIGEALALTPADYNPATGCVSISRTRHPGGRTGPPKSKLGTRTISVPTLARPLVAQGGGQLTYRATINAWRALLAALDLAYRNQHQLRHSVASHLLAQGVPIPDLAKYLGHSAAMLVKIYAHATGVDCGARLDTLLNEAPAKKGKRAKKGR